MVKTELLKLIKQGESQTISLKALKAKPSILSMPMVSFSNTNDGTAISRREYVTLTNISLRQANKDLKDLLEKECKIYDAWLVHEYLTGRNGRLMDISSKFEYTRFSCYQH